MREDEYIVLTHTGKETSLCYAIQLITVAKLVYGEMKGHSGSDRGHYVMSSSWVNPTHPVQEGIPGHLPL